MGAGGGGGMGDVSVSVVIHVNGSDAPEETARLVKRSLETELGGVFERIAAERAA
jgi:hypothetical protein